MSEEKQNPQQDRRSESSPSPTGHREASESARADGLLDPRLVDADPKTWPRWAQVRHVGDELLSEVPGDQHRAS